MSKFGRKFKEAPEGWDYIEPIMTALDNELREKVNEPHEGLRKTETQWPIHQINWQRSRYIYDMYYTFNRISRELYDYCISNKLVDAALIAKWKKPGYERLCSTYAINPRNYKFGTVSICRVPKNCLAPGTNIEDPNTGCRGCASGSGGAEKNIFGNRYGQYLAAIQVAREERQYMREKQQQEEEEEDEDGEDEDDNNNDDKKVGGKRHSKIGGGGDGDGDGAYDGVVGAADGSSGKKPSIWANEGETVELSDDILGVADPTADREGRAAAKHVGGGGGGGSGSGSGGGKYGDGPPGKRSRH